MIPSGLCPAQEPAAFDGAVMARLVAAAAPTWKIMYSLKQGAYYMVRGPAPPWDQRVSAAVSFEAAAQVLQGLHYHQLGKNR